MTRHNKTDRGIWPLLIGLAATIILSLVIIGVTVPGLPNSSVAQVTQNPIAPTAINQKSQATPLPLPPATQASLPQAVLNLSTDQQTQSAQATQNAQATENYIATDSALKQIVAATVTYEATLIRTPVPGPTGIYDDFRVKAQLGKEGFDVENAWLGIVNGNTVGVYAGAPHDDPNQGMLKVFVNLPDQFFMT